MAAIMQLHDPLCGQDRHVLHALAQLLTFVRSSTLKALLSNETFFSCDQSEMACFRHDLFRGRWSSAL
jgi:hypothetical protein